ncbi:MAG: PHP domain-containing protein [Candidatus Anstonellaceae archaeon]
MVKKKEFSADFHIHSHYSFDSLSKVEDILHASQKANLDAIAITDHNSIEGALEARDFAKESGLRLQVIVGEEVSTDKGDLLVYFLKKKIEPGSLQEVLQEVKAQRAVCCAAHPYDRYREGIPLPSLLPKTLSQIDAIEVFNARASLPSFNDQALKFASMNSKPFLAGSDAHGISEIGAAKVVFEGISKLDAKSILAAKRRIVGKLSPKYVHLFSRYAVLGKKLGWK